MQQTVCHCQPIMSYSCIFDHLFTIFHHIHHLYTTFSPYFTNCSPCRMQRVLIGRLRWALRLSRSSAPRILQLQVMTFAMLVLIWTAHRPRCAPLRLLYQPECILFSSAWPWSMYSTQDQLLPLSSTCPTCDGLWGLSQHRELLKTVRTWP